MKLDNTVAAVVTGGASGLGAATARALAAKGVKVAIFDLQEEKGKAMAAELPRASYHQADLGDETAARTALDFAFRKTARPRESCAGRWHTKGLDDFFDRPRGHVARAVRIERANDRRRRQTGLLRKRRRLKPGDLHHLS